MSSSDTAVVTTPTAVPEPSTLAIAGLGDLGLPRERLAASGTPIKA